VVYGTRRRLRTNYGQGLSRLTGIRRDFRFEPLSRASYISPALDNNEFATRAGPNEISGAHLRTLLGRL
jgi:hypothetical protein